MRQNIDKIYFSFEMIYLDNGNIIVPNLLGIDSSIYTIVLKNNVTNEEFTLDASNLSDN